MSTRLDLSGAFDFFDNDQQESRLGKEAVREVKPGRVGRAMDTPGRNFASNGFHRELISINKPASESQIVSVLKEASRPLRFFWLKGNARRVLLRGVDAGC